MSIVDFYFNCIIIKYEDICDSKPLKSDDSMT